MSYFNCNIYKSKNWNKDLNTTKQTNADKIRNMTDEELAEFLSSINTGRDIGYDYFSAKGGIFIESNKNIIKKVQDWLQSERWE